MLMRYPAVSRHWTEKFDHRRHRQHMCGAAMSMPPPNQKIPPQQMFFVAVAGFTFEFTSLGEIETALRYFSTKVRPTSRWPWPDVGMSHWEAERWFDRIPMKLLKESRRTKVIAALKTALADFRHLAQEA